MAMKKIFTVLCCILLCQSVTAGFTLPANRAWTFEFDVNNEVDYFLRGLAYQSSDTVGHWFAQWIGSQYVSYGGIGPALSSQYVDNSYGLISRNPPNPVYGGIEFRPLVRIDEDGWVVAFIELYNTLATPQNGVSVSNYRIGFGNGDSARLATNVYATSNGDGSIDPRDSWFILNDPRPVSSTNNNVLIAAFAEPDTSAVLEQAASSPQYIRWKIDGIDIPAKESVSLITVLTAVPDTARSSAITKARNLDDGNALYQALSSSGRRLLSHLTRTQLESVINWTFFSGGVGGDPHGRHFDGSSFEIPNQAGKFYCLFHDKNLQANIAVGKAGFVTEIVLFSRFHGITIHASINSDGEPEYFVNGEPLEVPDSRFEGLISTHEAPFNFQQSPLNELSRYHVNSLMIRGEVTIVGGTVLWKGPVGFFNVAIHRYPSETEFPAILQLPFHPERDSGFSASLIPDVWFDLAE